MIKPIYVANRDDRNDDADESKRTEAEPAIETSVQPSDKYCDRACGKIVHQHSARIQVPYFAECTPRAQYDRRVDGGQIHQEVRGGKNEEDA